MKHRITPFLWFNDQAEEAAPFYTSIFRKSKITDLMRYGEEGPGRRGTVMSVTFQLEGQEVIALNGGPHFKFSPAISFFVKCETQAEVDALWTKLSRGGKKMQCGWLTDRFGVTWQVVPTMLGEMLQDEDPKRAGNVMSAMMKMTKLDIKKLRRAFEKR
jgi:predicted 3-demethylubiquinone-9 3-methyltransferase (glyoxalase superfamily)